MKTIILTCEYCHSKFNRLFKQHKLNIFRQRKHIFCSNSCRGSFRNTQIEVQCQHCKILFMKQRSEIGGNNFCNKSCAASVNNTKKTKTKVLKICESCGTLTKNKNFCSCTCSGKAHRKYKTSAEALAAKRACGREAYARYSARKKFQTPIDADLTSIKLFYLNCPGGFEVDHIIPISKGGAHTLSNLQYLSSLDNKRKNAKLNWIPALSS